MQNPAGEKGRAAGSDAPANEQLTHVRYADLCACAYLHSVRKEQLSFAVRAKYANDAPSPTPTSKSSLRSLSRPEHRESSTGYLYGYGTAASNICGNSVKTAHIHTNKPGMASLCKNWSASATCNTLPRV